MVKIINLGAKKAVYYYELSNTWTNNKGVTDEQIYQEAELGTCGLLWKMIMTEEDNHLFITIKPQSAQLTMLSP